MLNIILILIINYLGSVPRNDLCAGTVQLIIDGNINTIVTVYLDSKPQVVNIAGKQQQLIIVKYQKYLLTILSMMKNQSISTSV